MAVASKFGYDPQNFISCKIISIVQQNDHWSTAGRHVISRTKNLGQVELYLDHFQKAAAAEASKLHGSYTETCMANGEQRGELVQTCASVPLQNFEYLLLEKYDEKEFGILSIRFQGNVRLFCMILEDIQLAGGLQCTDLGRMFFFQVGSCHFIMSKLWTSDRTRLTNMNKNFVNSALFTS